MAPYIILDAPIPYERETNYVKIVNANYVFKNF